MKQYGREGSKIIEDNMVKDMLQLSDPDSIRTAKDWTGRFMERNVSVSSNEKLSSNISWAKQDIFESSDFSSLAGQQKVIVVPLDDHFMRITKSQWFREPEFIEMQKEITARPDEKD